MPAIVSWVRLDPAKNAFPVHAVGANRKTAQRIVKRRRPGGGAKALCTKFPGPVATVANAAHRLVSAGGMTGARANIDEVGSAEFLIGVHISGVSRCR